MRIALIAHVRHPIAPPFMGGMEAHSWHLAHGLRARGHDVTLFASGDSDPQFDIFPVLERHYDADYPWHIFHGTDRLNAHVDQGFARTCAALRDGGFDVIHNNSLHRYVPRLGRAAGLPMVTSLHVPPFEALQRAVHDSAVPWSRFTVTSARQVESWWPDGAPPEASVVYNGIDLTLWPFSATGDGSAVWAGRLTPNKAPHLAVQAAAIAGIGLKLFGVIEDQGYFDTLIRPFLTPAIQYGGHLDSVALAAAFRRASVLVLTPQWDEPFGLVAIEAMASGLPVAALNMGAVAEVIGEAGVLSDSPAPADLARAMLSAQDIPRIAARARVERLFSMSRMIAGYEACYAQARAGLNETRPQVHFPPWDLAERPLRSGQPSAPRPGPAVPS